MLACIWGNAVVFSSSSNDTLTRLYSSFLFCSTCAGSPVLFLQTVGAFCRIRGWIQAEGRHILQKTQPRAPLEPTMSQLSCSFPKGNVKARIVLCVRLHVEPGHRGVSAPCAQVSRSLEQAVRGYCTPLPAPRFLWWRALYLGSLLLLDIVLLMLQAA